MVFKNLLGPHSSIRIWLLDVSITSSNPNDTSKPWCYHCIITCVISTCKICLPLLLVSNSKIRRAAKSNIHSMNLKGPAEGSTRSTAYRAV